MSPQPVFNMVDKAELAIEIAKYGSTDVSQIEDTAVSMLDLSYEALESIRTLLEQCMAAQP